MDIWRIFKRKKKEKYENPWSTVKKKSIKEVSRSTRSPSSTGYDSSTKDLKYKSSSSEDYSRNLSKRVLELIKAKRFDEAIKEAERIDDSYWKSLALRDIAIELAKLMPIEQLRLLRKLKIVIGNQKHWEI